MEQINFRISAEEKKILQAIAESQSTTVADLARNAILAKISPIRVDLAFKLLQEGKIGRKRAWILSGLSYHEFMLEWTRRGAEEHLPEEILEKELDLIHTLDITEILKK